MFCYLFFRRIDRRRKIVLKFVERIILLFKRFPSLRQIVRPTQSAPGINKSGTNHNTRGIEVWAAHWLAALNAFGWRETKKGKIMHEQEKGRLVNNFSDSWTLSWIIETDASRSQLVNQPVRISGISVELAVIKLCLILPKTFCDKERHEASLITYKIYKIY